MPDKEEQRNPKDTHVQKVDFTRIRRSLFGKPIFAAEDVPVAFSRKSRFGNIRVQVAS